MNTGFVWAEKDSGAKHLYLFLRRVVNDYLFVECMFWKSMQVQN